MFVQQKNANHVKLPHLHEDGTFEQSRNGGPEASLLWNFILVLGHIAKNLSIEICLQGHEKFCENPLQKKHIYLTCRSVSIGMKCNLYNKNIQKLCALITKCSTNHSLHGDPMFFCDSFQNQLIKPPGFDRFPKRVCILKKTTHTSLHFLASAKAWIHGKMQENVSKKKKKKTKNLEVFFLVTFFGKQNRKYWNRTCNSFLKSQLV